MPSKRIFGRPGSSYHVISRFVDKKYALGSEREKRVFYNMMVNQAAFAGVELLTFCLMSNHFHILVRVPEPPAELPEASVLERLTWIWSEEKIEEFAEKLMRLRQSGRTIHADALVDQLRRRMYSLPEFVKDLKQRYSIWYNRSNERLGTLFEERYKSVLVQDGQALRFMAAYIDLNPVRAGMVQDPADYAWCGYAKAVAGNRTIRRGLRRVMANPHAGRAHAAPWRDVSRRYRLWLFERGIRKTKADGTEIKAGFTRQQAWDAWKEGGAVPPATLLRCKIRYLVDGGILGTQAFIETFIQRRKKNEPSALGTYAKANSTGIAAAADGDEPPLCSLRRLRGDPLG